MPIYDPAKKMSEQGLELDNALRTLTQTHRYEHAVHVMETGMENAVVSLEPYDQADGYVVSMTFRLAVGTVPQDGDLLVAPHDDFPFEHVELHWPDEVIIKRPHSYFIFDVRKSDGENSSVPDLAAQWQAHAIRTRPTQGFGYFHTKHDKNTPIATTRQSTRLTAEMREPFLGYGPGKPANEREP